SAVAFLKLADRSPQGRRFLIRELCLQDRPRRARLLARLCEVIPADGLDFLEGIDAPVAAEVALDLIERRARLSEKKAAHLARLLAEKLTAGQVGPFLSAWLSRPQPHDDSFGLAVLGAISRLPESRFLEQAVKALPLALLRKFLTAATSC